MRCKVTEVIKKNYELSIQAAGGELWFLKTVKSHNNLSVVFVSSFRCGVVRRALHGNEISRDDSHSCGFLFGHVPRQLA